MGVYVVPLPQRISDPAGASHALHPYRILGGQSQLITGDQGGVNQRSWTRETVYGEQESYIAEGRVTISPFGVVWDYYEPVQEIMDNEVRYFFDEFYPGLQEVAFLFRTTTPGVYPTPPAQAMAMYEEEVFGRTSGTLMVIKQ